ncbi:tetratricopeptide repeat protein [Novosphingobium sp. M1R2S20]|uniref:Tetratricopeptide repeat protein n=1 Tax=Novosphingobium rhizovicinum TaxID=3228928 RepID=A0ABV3R7Z8_9SPHN
MQAKFNRSVRGRAAMRTALAVAVATGCMAAPGFAYAKARSKAVEANEAQASSKLEAQVAAAEREALAVPREADRRVKLAQSYLSAGRFVSASASFEDAVSLGDTSPATALGMALSYIGSGRNNEAVALLEQWRESIPVSDFALALALAGQPGNAVTLLGDVVRSGENTATTRQNLAYAYALGGQLREARIIASQDVPADQLDARLSEWALQASVGSQQSRVAALLGAPLRSDPGQPVQLALSSAGQVPALAAAETPATRELPPMSNASRAIPSQVPAEVELAADDRVAAAPSTLAVVEPDTHFVSQPVVQSAAIASVAKRQVATPVAQKSASGTTQRNSQKASVVSTPGDYAVQLGSFSSEEGAHRAWNLFVRKDPSLKERTLRITEAVVNGRRFWRVAAAGFEAGEARAKCLAVRGQGRGCFAYVDSRKLPGASPLKAAQERLATR